MNLREFSDTHGGLKLLIRRHLQSRKIPPYKMLHSSPHEALAVRLGRILNDQLQGLSAEGTQNAFAQGKAFAELGIWPRAIIYGLDQRNIDGALSTAEGMDFVAKLPANKKLGKQAPTAPQVMGNPGITYPHYGNLNLVVKLNEEHDDEALYEYGAFLKHISGLYPETAGFWTEPVVAVEGRLMCAVDAVRNGQSEWGLQLWDTNYEQMIIWHQRVCMNQPLSKLQVEFNGGFWPYDPDYGAGIVIACDGTIAEFTSALEIGSSAKRV